MNPMFVVLLELSNHRDKAGQLMNDDNAWIQRGFDDGVLLLVGSLKPNLGGAIVVHPTSLSDRQRSVRDDAFVAAEMVSAEIPEVSLSKADTRLDFLGGP